MPKITVIPAITAPTIEEVTFKKKRVAAYARVSTDSEEQLTSYEAQVDYYTHYIKQNPEWEYVDVYTDEGISATNTKHRDGFNRMIADALSGRIDLIITKSVSRFARNTVDSLTTVRKLKDKGVEVYFQKENIYTLDSKGELLITIMSSLAQEESRSISENTTWGTRKRFADGKVNLPYGNFLGYKKGEDGRPEIVPEEAETVRLIYRLFISGMTPYMIAKHLTSQGIPTPGGKKKWSQSTVLSILTNEKYKGDALLQKSFTVDFLTKKMKVNEGEVPQYYVENSHPAIINPDEFDVVQAELAKRAKVPYSSTSAFSSKLICEDCGSFFGAKVWHSNDKYRRVIYQCNKKFEHNCETPHLYEQQIIDKFMKAYADFFSDRENIIKNCKTVLSKLKPADETELQEQLNGMEHEFEKIVSGDSNADFNELNEKYNTVKAELEKRKADNLNKKARFTQIRAMLKILETPAEFDEKLWTVLIEKATVKRNGEIVFTFKDGREIRV